MRFLTTAAFWAYFTTSSLDGAAAQQGGLRRKLVAKQDCTLQVVEALSLDGAHDDDDMIFECELDAEDADGYTGINVEIELDKEQKKEMKELIKEGNAKPGMDKINTNGMSISNGKAKFPPGQKMKDTIKSNNGNGNGKRRLAATTNTMGDLTMLLVRVTDVNGLVHPDNAATMSDEVFGTGVDLVNLKTNLEECSWNQVTVIPGVGDPNEVAVGVVEVSIGISLETNTSGDIRNAVNAALQDKLGHGLPGPYTHVLHSLESCYGNDCGWAAYAYINSWNSVYQANYYKRPGVLTHEIGHNFGLAHSGGLNGATYTDHTGSMGNPHYSDDGFQCFNAAKNYQLPWYADSKITVDPRTAGFSETVTFVGIGEYPQAQAGGFPVVARLVTQGGDANGGDYFVGFNRATGPNRLNDEADDEVTIVQVSSKTGSAAIGEYYSQSYLRATLLQGETYTIEDYAGTGQTVTITADSIDTSSIPGKAVVTIASPQTISPAPTPTPCDNYEDLEVRLTTDSYPSEISWTIKKDLTNPCEHKQFDPDIASPSYSSSNTAQAVFQESVCRGKYVFDIKDTYGDGICCSYGNGGYEVYYAGVLVASGGDYGSGEVKNFGACDSTGPPPSPSPTNPPTPVPSNAPTPPPTNAPVNPTSPPSNAPTTLPPTPSPTTAPPTPSPTNPPTPNPTNPPTSAPTPVPTNVPTPNPTNSPTNAPTPVPTNPPTPAPTPVPTNPPTPNPTNPPTPNPTNAPTNPPPTPNPTNPPTPIPTNAPTPPPTSAPVESVDKYVCAKNEPLAATICADGVVAGGECTSVDTNNGCGKGGKSCWWASCPGGGGGPSPTNPPAPEPTNPPAPTPSGPTNPPVCPVCAHTGEPCCGTCVSGGKPSNRGCFTSQG